MTWARKNYLGSARTKYKFNKSDLLRNNLQPELFQHIPNMIVNIQTVGHRIYVSDVQESVYSVRYKRMENQLIIFADDTYPRWVTCTAVLDFDTVAIADKFGNIAVVSKLKF
jgi:CPSF A subunit region